MSIHIGPKKGKIAETVFFPGAPLRAKWIADTYLEDVHCYNKVRNMFGYTGTYKGRKISVQGTGMGVPSISIYAHELINDFDVKNLIRVGSAGSYQKSVKLRDIVIAMAASSTSGINQYRFRGAVFTAPANCRQFYQAMESVTLICIRCKAGSEL